MRGFECRIDVGISEVSDGEALIERHSEENLLERSIAWGGIVWNENVASRYFRRVRQGEGALDAILEFARVSWPWGSHHLS